MQLKMRRKVSLQDYCLTVSTTLWLSQLLFALNYCCPVSTIFCLTQQLFTYLKGPHKIPAKDPIRSQRTHVVGFNLLAFIAPSQNTMCAESGKFQRVSVFNYRVPSTTVYQSVSTTVCHQLIFALNYCMP